MRFMLGRVGRGDTKEIYETDERSDDGIWGELQTLPQNHQAVDEEKASAPPLSSCNNMEKMDATVISTYGLQFPVTVVYISAGLGLPYLTELQIP